MYSWMKVDCCFNKLSLKIDFDPMPYQWYSVCWSITLNTTEDSAGKVVIDGEVKDAQRVVKEDFDFVDIDGNGLMILGQEQDNQGLVFDYSESFSGELSDFNLFNRSIDCDDMIKWTEGKKEIDTPYLASFDEIENFELSEATVSQRNFSDFFQNILPFFRFFSRSVSFQNAIVICNGVGGTLVSPRNEKENIQLFDLISATDSLCSNRNTHHDLVWLGVVKDPHNFIKVRFVNYKTGMTHPFSFFTHLSSDRSPQQSCVTFYGCTTKSSYWHRRWSTLNCKEKREVICRFDQFPYIKLRGLCDRTRFDTRYFIGRNFVNPNLQGLYGSSLRLINFVTKENATRQRWELSNVHGDLAYLELKEGEYKLVTGRHNWTFESDKCGYEVQPLVFTSCKQSEYTCDDGTCIPLIERCNYEMNCPDGSDESKCDILVFPKTPYYSTIPPPKLPFKDKFEIEISLKIERIVELSLEDLQLKTNVRVHLEWFDSLIKFANLKDSTARNTVSLPRHQLPWLPQIRFSGHNFSVTETKLVETTIKVVKRTKRLDDDLSRIDEGLCFIMPTVLN